MDPALKAFLQRWLITTIAVLVAANVVPGIRYDTVPGVFIASLLLGILNAFVRPFMLLLSFPFLIATLGLFVLFINAFLLYVVGQIVRSFHVETFGAAFWGGLVISLVSLAVNALTGTGGSRVQVRRHRGTPPPPRPPADGGGPSGPVIDV